MLTKWSAQHWDSEGPQLHTIPALMPTTSFLFSHCYRGIQSLYRVSCFASQNPTTQSSLWSNTEFRCQLQPDLGPDLPALLSISCSSFHNISVLEPSQHGHRLTRDDEGVSQHPHSTWAVHPGNPYCYRHGPPLFTHSCPGQKLPSIWHLHHQMIIWASVSSIPLPQH